MTNFAQTLLAQHSRCEAGATPSDYDSERVAGVVTLAGRLSGRLAMVDGCDLAWFVLDFRWYQILDRHIRQKQLVG